MKLIMGYLKSRVPDIIYREIFCWPILKLFLLTTNMAIKKNQNYQDPIFPKLEVF